MPRQHALLVSVVLACLACLKADAIAQMKTFWPDPVANEIVPYLTGQLTHGPMLGRPTSTSIRVWIRTAKPMSFRVVYDTDLPLSKDTSGVEGKTTAKADNTGHVDLTELKPNTRYYYGIVTGGHLVDTRKDVDDPWPFFRTIPDADTYRDPQFNPRGLYNVCFSIGTGNCQNPLYKRGGQYVDAPAFRSLWKQHRDEVMFHFMNGDYIYEELRDGTLDGYRNNYKLYMSRGRGMSRLMRYLPWMFVFDDHELTGEQGMGDVGLGKGPWCDRDEGVRAWYEYAGWANYPARHRGPLYFGQAKVKQDGNLLTDPEADFSRLNPDRVSTVMVPRGNKNAGVYGLVKARGKAELEVKPSFRATETCDYTIGTHHYYDWKMSNCHFFALDTRGERAKFSLEKQFDADQFILGEAQRKWLMDGIERSDAEFIFILSGVPWVLPHTTAHVGGTTDPKGDTFVGFVHERERLLEFFDELDKPVLILTGDVHNSFSVQITDNVWEFMCGPMNSAAHPIATTGKCPYGGWYDSAGRKVKVKWVAGFPTMHYTRLHSTLYAVVQVNNVLKSGRPDEPGYHFVAYDAPTAVVRFYDAYTGKLLYAESVSTLDVE
ncbi:MAG: alkaline phosphatase D family protein [Planctomycetota bacterium]